MTETRIEFRGRLGDAPKVAIVDGATLAGAPVVSRLPGRDGKCGGDWCLFVSAMGAAGEVLAGCQRDDTVSVAGEVHAVQSVPSTDGRATMMVVEVQAATVERREPRH